MFQFIQTECENEIYKIAVFEVLDDDKIIILNRYEDGLLDADRIIFPRYVDKFSKMHVELLNPHNFSFKRGDKYDLLLSYDDGNAIIDVFWDDTWCPNYVKQSPRQVNQGTISYFMNRKQLVKNKSASHLIGKKNTLFSSLTDP